MRRRTTATDLARDDDISLSGADRSLRGALDVIAVRAPGRAGGVADRPEGRDMLGAGDAPVPPGRGHRMAACAPTVPQAASPGPGVPPRNYTLKRNVGRGTR